MHKTYASFKGIDVYKDILYSRCFFSFRQATPDVLICKDYSYGHGKTYFDSSIDDFMRNEDELFDFCNGDGKIRFAFYLWEVMHKTFAKLRNINICDKETVGLFSYIIDDYCFSGKHSSGAGAYGFVDGGGGVGTERELGVDGEIRNFTSFFILCGKEDLDY